MPIQSGTDIGRYHILEQLGEGGMAVVYKAYDTRLESEVAVKAIRTERLIPEYRERTLRRFQIEAKKMAALQHSNIVGVKDYGEFEGVPYLVLEYLPGGTLKEKLGKPVPCGEAARWMLPVARALAYAHSRGLVHRDVKPSNILVTESGDPMLTDFGIAKIIAGEETLDLTITGMGVGTPEYMAPEQAEGKAVDERADIYALGVILYELLTGRKPFTADTPMAVIVKQIHDPLPDPKEYLPGFPDAAARVLYKALAKKPEDRYKDMSEMAAALEKLAGMQTEMMHEKPIEKVKETFKTQTIHDKHAAEDIEQTTDPGITGRGEKPAPQRVVPLEAGRDHAPINPPATIPWVPIGIAGLFIVVLIISSSLSRNASISQRTSEPEPTRTAESQTSYGIATKVSSMDGMTLVYVPAGEFLMGSEEGDDDEKPVHRVYLDAFWIDQTEVTHAQYRQCVEAGVCKTPWKTDYYNDQRYRDHPVVYVSWYDAEAYCGWAGRRLPTEAEWEKAARGTDGRAYPWGNQAPDNSLLNFDQNEGGTTRVGNYPSGASPYGALDMAGNVWEWVADWYNSGYYANSPARDPQGPSSGNYRVLRGGSWSSSEWGVRAAFRSYDNPAGSYGGYGFRCALSP